MPSSTEDCSICSVELGTGPNGPAKTAMGHQAGAVWHAFHLHCISKWQGQGHDDCPLCRAKVNPWVEVRLS